MATQPYSFGATIVSVTALYRPAHTDYGPRWNSERIIDRHPESSDHLATFTPLNLRAPATGAELFLGRLAGGYLLPGFKQAYMDMARTNEPAFE